MSAFGFVVGAVTGFPMRHDQFAKLLATALSASRSRSVQPAKRSVAGCAENFVRAVKQEASAAGVANASFFTTDVQTDGLRGPYDYAFARFGTIFS